MDTSPSSSMRMPTSVCVHVWVLLRHVQISVYSTVSENVAMGGNWRGLETRSEIEVGAGIKTRSVRGSVCMEIWAM